MVGIMDPQAYFQIDEVSRLNFLHRDALMHQKTSDDKILYHYTTPEGLLGILENKELWYSNIDYLNDESEIRYTHKLLVDILLIKKDVIVPGFYKSIKKYCESVCNAEYCDIKTGFEQSEKIYVASFSITEDNLSVWNNYTKNPNCTGYNIAFRKEHLLRHIGFNNVSNLIHGKIIYDRDKQKQMLENALLDYNNLIHTITINERALIDSFKELIRIFSLFFKQNVFANEAEYRIILIDNVESDEIKSKISNKKYHFRIHNGAFIPYIKHSFNKSSIRKIFISPTIKQNYYKTSINHMLKKLGYKSITVHNSKIPLRY